MSGEYPMLLRRRALKALNWAERALEEGDYDTAAREAEYAAQLYLKSIIYRVLGEEVRGHNIRELMGVLISALLEEGFSEEANMLADYSRRKRRELAELSEAHTRATYGLVEYTRASAELLVRIARDIVEILRRLEVRIFGGGEAETAKHVEEHCS
ncbi:MAG: HEPN domain-containing protein [Sulfolobales archaeon]